MEVVIKKGEKWLLKKLIEIRNNYQERNEVVRLENERIIFWKCLLEWSMDY
jgi:hypothetical protein